MYACMSVALILANVWKNFLTGNAITEVCSTYTDILIKGYVIFGKTSKQRLQLTLLTVNGKSTR